ncbi:RHS repeat domain-containing protein [Ferviditalea candida]|uniref:RHS repeat domain-containing protein n=1 Tax=Ferviditalea candida TaxID=3108399 RepID=A0ABU5ZDF2_9BACL|nr:RHS repeat domain-containing protein [Paenibacillaceae bacterium T2]
MPTNRRQRLRTTHDAENNLLAVTDHLGNRTTFEYDGNNNKIKETDAKLHSTSYSFNANNKLVSMTDALGNVRQGSDMG